MWRWIIKDTLISILTLFLTLFIVYVLYTSVYSNPLQGRLKDFVGNPEGYTILLHANKIDYPVVERFGFWIQNLFNGDFSKIYALSTLNSQGVTSDIPSAFFDYLKTSMQVQVPAFIFGMIFGLGLGFVAGYNYASKKARGKIVDSAISGFVSVFSALPMIVLAAFALLLAPLLNLKSQYEAGAGITVLVKSLILPVLISTLVSMTTWAITMRIEVAAVLSSDYILAARTRGYSGWFIFRRYVFRNTMYPIASRIATAYLIVFASSYVVEIFFGLNGPAKWFYDAVIGSEVNIVMFQLLFFGAISRVLEIFGNAVMYSVNPTVKASFGQGRNYIEIFRAWNTRRVDGDSDAIVPIQDPVLTNEEASND